MQANRVRKTECVMSELKRCSWCGNDPLYVKYHDEEWGVPVRNDQAIFEFLILETFQAGLSWITVLRKRENFRRAFAGFNVEAIARFTEEDIQRLMLDVGIIRNQLKIRAAVSNAQAVLKMKAEGLSLADYFWQWVDNTPVLNHFREISTLPARTELSDAISKDLKKRGFKFVGSTVIYAHLQACGIVNDHVVDCFRYAEAAEG